MDAFEAQKRVRCIWMTIEPRRKPWYISPEQYRTIANSINQQMKRLKKGRIFLTGGMTYPPSLVGADDIHPSEEAYSRIREKINCAIVHYHQYWFRQRLLERDRHMARLGLDHPDQLKVRYYRNQDPNQQQDNNQ